MTNTGDSLAEAMATRKGLANDEMRHEPLETSLPGVSEFESSGQPMMQQQQQQQQLLQPKQAMDQYSNDPVAMEQQLHQMKEMQRQMQVDMQQKMNELEQEQLRQEQVQSELPMLQQQSALAAQQQALLIQAQQMQNPDMGQAMIPDTAQYVGHENNERLANMNGAEAPLSTLASAAAVVSRHEFQKPMAQEMHMQQQPPPFEHMQPPQPPLEQPGLENIHQPPQAARNGRSGVDMEMELDGISVVLFADRCVFLAPPHPFLMPSARPPFHYPLVPLLIFIFWMPPFFRHSFSPPIISLTIYLSQSIIASLYHLITHHIGLVPPPACPTSFSV
jgi:hypothetical protein